MSVTYAGGGGGGGAADDASSNVRLIELGEDGDTDLHWLRGVLELTADALVFTDLEDSRPAARPVVGIPELLPCSAAPPAPSALPRLPHAGLWPLQVNAVSRKLVVLVDSPRERELWRHRLDRAVVATHWGLCRVLMNTPARAVGAMSDAAWERRKPGAVVLTSDHRLHLCAELPPAAPAAASRRQAPIGGLRKSAKFVGVLAEAVRHFAVCADAPPACNVVELGVLEPKESRSKNADKSTRQYHLQIRRVVTVVAAAAATGRVGLSDRGRGIDAEEKRPDGRQRGDSGRGAGGGGNDDDDDSSEQGGGAVDVAAEARNGPFFPGGAAGGGGRAGSGDSAVAAAAVPAEEHGEPDAAAQDFLDALDDLCAGRRAHFARLVRVGNVSAVQELLASSPLLPHHAEQRRAFFLGAAPSAADLAANPLAVALLAGQDMVVQRLIAYDDERGGELLSQQAYPGGHTLLHLLVSQRQTPARCRLIGTLVSAKIDISVQDAHGLTALQLAHDMGRTEFANALQGQRLLMDVADQITSGATSSVARQPSAYLDNVRV